MLLPQQFNSRLAVYKFVTCFVVLFVEEQYFGIFNTLENIGSVWKPMETTEFSRESSHSTGVLLFADGGYGLGNQLFFYALSYSLSRNLGIRLLLSLPTELNTGDHSNHKNFSSRDIVLHHLSLPGGIYTDYDKLEPNVSIYDVTCEMAENKSLIPLEALETYKFFSLESYCFDWRFFRRYEEELKTIHVIVESPSEGYQRWGEVIEGEEWPVAVHVRKGDLSSQYWNAPISYFKEAMRIIMEKAPKGLKLVFLVFSDEMKWAKEGLNEGFFLDKLLVPVYFVSGTFDGLTNLEELDLMIKCKSIIISNSTFSWWAAFLMISWKNQKMVIRPQFNSSWHTSPEDRNKSLYEIVYPDEWIALNA